MKRVFPAFLLMFFLAVAFIHTQAAATGMGFYIEQGYGSSEWTVEFEGTTYEPRSWDSDGDMDRTAFGFVFDTAVAKDSLFNYRFQLGYETWEDEVDGSGNFLMDGFTVEMEGVTMTHDFGFGILRTPTIRIWLGPELKFSYTTGSPDSYKELDVKLFKYGIGPAIGANFNLGSILSLGVKAGYLFQDFIGTGENDLRLTGPHYHVEYDFDGSSNEFFINFAILFRFGDTY